jgi:predicted NUDIX family phosphoesterase
MSQTQSNNASTVLLSDKWNERILVIKRDNFFPNGSWSGLKSVDFDYYLNMIQNKKEFIARGLAETDYSYKQIIPYLVFEHEGSYFLMQRKTTSSESRLASKYSLGIGGHLREEDTKGAGLFEWATREFEEEINYSGRLEIEPLGLLNDDSNDVGKVHIGFVFLLKGSSDNISVKSELACGELLSLDACKARYAAMETWSQLVFDFLQSR